MKISSKLIDKIGISASILCAIHCFLTPVLITVAPLVGLGFLFNESVENIIIVSAFSLALFSLSWCYATKHRNLIPLYIFLFAGILVVLSRVDQTSLSWPEPVLMTFAGLTLAASHYMNVKLCETCHSCSDHQH